MQQTAPVGGAMLGLASRETMSTTLRASGPAFEPEANAPGADAWALERAALFLGVSPRTLERWVARRVVPCICYPPARVEEGKGTKPIIAFDPDELATWRDQQKVGRLKRAG